MLVVRDVVETSQWFQKALGLTSGHGGDQFEMLMADGQAVLYLHHDGPAEHPTLPASLGTEPGKGVLLYFYVEDVDTVYHRAVQHAATVLDEPHDNPLAHTREFSLRDPNGYGLTVAQTHAGP